MDVWDREGEVDMVQPSMVACMITMVETSSYMGRKGAG